MKITPMAQGLGVAGADISSTQSPDRKQAAIQAFKGEIPVSVKESDTPIDPTVSKRALTKPTITMKTDATPGEREQVVESASVDTAVEIAPVVADTKPIDPQLAEIAKARRALQVKERELAEREKAITSAPAESQESLIEKLKADPMGVLQEAGVTYDQLTEAILSGQSGLNPEIQSIQKEMKSLKEDFQKTLSDRDQQQEQQVLKEIRNTVDALAASGDEFEMIRVRQAQQDVVSLIHQVFKTEGKVLTEREAARLVEEELIKEGLELASTNKLKAKLNPAQPEQQQRQPQMKTLTSRGNASVQMSRKERAMAAFHGNNKK